MEGRLIWMVAQETSLYANIHRRQGSNPFTAKEFIPTWAGEELTDEEEWEVMNANFESYNSRVANYEAKRQKFFEENELDS